jgi:hypothetical protein
MLLLAQDQYQCLGRITLPHGSLHTIKKPENASWWMSGSWSGQQGGEWE